MSTNNVCTVGSKLACMSSKIVKAGNTGIFALKQHSPEILTVVGVVGVVAATVMACKATLKAKDVLDKHEDMMATIKEAQESKDPDYTETDVQKDKVIVYVNTVKDFAILYGPAVVTGALSLTCLVGANIILKKRNIALAAAYSLVEKSFKQYRNRVIEELGESKDFHFRYGTDYETVTEEVTDENGKTKKVKKQVQVLNPANEQSMYARLYDEQIFDTNGSYTGSSQWSPNPDYNANNLYYKNLWANDQLKAKGYLFLNDVYEELGFPRTKAGQVVGWLWKNGVDEYVSFGPEVDAIINKTPGYLSYRYQGPILLDFNVDGPILDKIE